LLAVRVECKVSAGTTNEFCFLRQNVPHRVEEFSVTHHARETGRFDGGRRTGDAGFMPTGLTDRQLGLLNAAVQCIADLPH
jgi:hypothetical protein